MDDKLTIILPTTDLGILSRVLTCYLDKIAPQALTDDDAELSIDAQRLRKEINHLLNIQLLKLQN